MKKEKKINSGDKCPLCKRGRIALAQILTNNAFLDQEPYKSGKMEGNCDEIHINEDINISLNACDYCGEVFSANIQNDFRKKISNNKEARE